MKRNAALLHIPKISDRIRSVLEEQKTYLFNPNLQLLVLLLQCAELLLGFHALLSKLVHAVHQRLHQRYHEIYILFREHRLIVDLKISVAKSEVLPQLIKFTGA